MNTETVKRAIRLAILAAAVVVFAHILTSSDRSNWLALVPAAVIASGVYRFGASALARTS